MSPTTAIPKPKTNTPTSLGRQLEVFALAKAEVTLDRGLLASYHNVCTPEEIAVQYSVLTLCRYLWDDCLPTSTPFVNK